MKIGCYSLIFLSLILCPSCNKSDQYNQKVKTLDSLSGSLNAMVKELEKADTVLLQKSIARFSYYRKFIIENIHDTVSKDQADNLKIFYEGGENLEAFAKNRNMILARARLVNSQLLKLKEDLKNNADPGIASKFILTEKAELSKLTETGYRQEEIFHKSHEKFKNAQHGVEELIKSRNKGSLPTIVKDTIAL